MGPSQDLVPLGDIISNDLRCSIPEEHLEELKSMLSRIVVGPNKTAVELEVDPEWTFNELLDSCRVALIKEGHMKNALTKGYQHALSDLTTAPAYTRCSNASNRLLRTPEWRLLHHCIGSRATSCLLTQFTAYEHQGNQFVQLFGDPLMTNKLDSHRNQYISLDPALYKSSQSVKYMSPIPSTKMELMESVFKNEMKASSSNKKLPPNLRDFAKLGSRAIMNHMNCSYFAILHSTCPNITTSYRDFIGYSVPKDKVMKFCITTFEKVFPSSLFGCNANKSVILRSLSKLVHGDKGTKITLDECLAGIKTSTIAWLSPGHQRKCNKQESLKQHDLLRQFIYWLFNHFFVKILASFFHITHISSEKTIHFFKHKVWKEISQPFLESYIDENLEVASDPLSVSQAESSPHLRSKLRVMPKKNNDFRAISVPFKGENENESFSFMEHIQKEIRPSKHVLNHIRITQRSRFPKLTSVSQIPLQIAVFKRKLRQIYGNVPDLFFLKFDARSCYDTLPQKKILEIVTGMIDIKEQYHYLEERELDIDTMQAKKSNRFGDFSDLCLLKDKRVPSMAGDRRHHILTGHEIIEVCRLQLNGTVTRVNKKLYKRKKGVFQGMHLSSLFCDLVYDDLIEKEFHFLDRTNSLVLRIADDFLVVSCEVEQLVKMKNMVERGFEDYGVSINKLKSAVNFGTQGQRHMSAEKTFTFCGYEIDVEQLNVIKRYDQMPPYTPVVNSHRLAVSSMIGIFRIRIKQNTLDTDLVPMEIITKQLRLLIQNLTTSYCKATENIQISTTGFSLLIDSLISETFMNLKGALSKDQSLRERLRAIIRSAFIQELRNNGAKFKDCLDYLVKTI